MELNFNLITVINTILCIIIFILGVTSTGKSKNIILLIAWAFGLFAISHIFKILNLANRFEMFLIVIRFTAYLLIVFGVAKLRKK
jgi:hypothetical protein